MQYKVELEATVEASSAEAAKLNRSQSNGSVSTEHSRLDTATIQAAKALVTTKHEDMTPEQRELVNAAKMVKNQWEALSSKKQIEVLDSAMAKINPQDPNDFSRMADLEVFVSITAAFYSWQLDKMTRQDHKGMKQTLLKMAEAGEPHPPVLSLEGMALLIYGRNAETLIGYRAIQSYYASLVAE